MLISLSGPAGAGKDRIAQELVEKHGFVRRALADPMKQIIADILGISIDEVNERKGKDPKMRRALQLLGTEVGRDCLGQNVWVEKVLREVASFEQGWRNSGGPAGGIRGVVITDTRFVNEFDALKAAGFAMIDVRCPQEFMRIPPGAPGYDHPSERDLDLYRRDGKFDLALWNDRTNALDLLVAEILDLYTKPVPTSE